MNECTCKLGADECTGDTGIYYPLQDGGMCSVRNCQKEINYEVTKKQNYSDDGVPSGRQYRD